MKIPWGLLASLGLAAPKPGRVWMQKDRHRGWTGIRARFVTIGETKAERSRRKMRAALLATGRFVDLREPGK